jgi:fatty-acyl-CoA synthase
MEGDILAMPAVMEVAVFAIPDVKWQERPMVAAGTRPDQQPSLAAILAHLLALGWQSWQLPDRLELVDSVPKTGVGKFDNKVLRARYGASPAPDG